MERSLEDSDCEGRSVKPVAVGGAENDLVCSCWSGSMPAGYRPGCICGCVVLGGQDMCGIVRMACGDWDEEGGVGQERSITVYIHEI